jgi:hypothetical protein
VSEQTSYSEREYEEDESEPYLYLSELVLVILESEEYVSDSEWWFEVESISSEVNEVHGMGEVTKVKHDQWFTCMRVTLECTASVLVCMSDQFVRGVACTRKYLYTHIKRTLVPFVFR